jgi:hypothetical protein
VRRFGLFFMFFLFSLINTKIVGGGPPTTAGETPALP